MASTFVQQTVYVQVYKKKINRTVFNKRVTGVEPVFSTWKEDYLPLIYTRRMLQDLNVII